MTAARLGALALALATALAAARGDALEPIVFGPSEFTWVPNPRGYTEATIVGDPTKPGIYTAHVRFPPGLRILPHSHPDDRVVTVLSGVVHMGYGERFDESRMRALPAGSVWTEPAGQAHYAWAKEGAVVLQVVGHGPSATTPVQIKD